MLPEEQEEADVGSFMAVLENSMMTGNCDWLPTVRFMERGQPSDEPDAGTLQGATGAFVPGSNEIILADDLRDDPCVVVVAVMHQFGHKIDEIVQPGEDAPGDEGLAFSLLASDVFYDDSQPDGLSLQAQAALRSEPLIQGTLTHPEIGKSVVEFFNPERAVGHLGRPFCRGCLR